jgi:hypothetical protein
VLLFNGVIYCEQNTIKNWLIIEQEKGIILATGTQAELCEVTNSNSWNLQNRIDLCGQFVLPVKLHIRFLLHLMLI